MECWAVYVFILDMVKKESSLYVLGYGWEWAELSGRRVLPSPYFFLSSVYDGHCLSPGLFSYAVGGKNTLIMSELTNSKYIKLSDLYSLSKTRLSLRKGLHDPMVSVEETYFPLNLIWMNCMLFDLFTPFFYCEHWLIFLVRSFPYGYNHFAFNWLHASIYVQ